MDNKTLFSIGEIANAVGITRKIVLNYESKGLITLDKKSEPGGNRYYTIDTFTKIRTIRIFQNLGLSLDEIREYFNDTSDLHQTIKRLEDMRNHLNLAIEKLKERSYGENHTIKEITVEPQTVYKRTYNSVTVAEKTNLLRNTALEAMKLHGTDITRRMYFTEYNLNFPEEVSYYVAVPAQSKGEYIQQIPAFRALSAFHHGAYEDIPAIREKLITFARQNGITLSGTFRNLYLEGPPQHKDKSKFITQIIAIIE